MPKITQQNLFTTITEVTQNIDHKSSDLNMVSVLGTTRGETERGLEQKGSDLD